MTPLQVHSAFFFVVVYEWFHLSKNRKSTHAHALAHTHSLKQRLECLIFIHMNLITQTMMIHNENYPRTS